MRRNRRDLANPESVANIIPIAIYNTHKIARKQIENQREQTQHTIAYLERQAKKSVKELEQKQKSLMDYYQLKQSRFQRSKEKEQYRNRSLKELTQQKLINIEVKEKSAMKRDLVRKEWESINKKKALEAKSFRSVSEKKLSEQRELERSLLKKKNDVFTQEIVLQTQHSRVKSQSIKLLMSNVVKNDLIQVQQNIKERELERITDLKERQEELLRIMEKAKKQQNLYDNALHQVKALPFELMSAKMKSVRSRGSRTRRGSSRSESFI